MILILCDTGNETANQINCDVNDVNSDLYKQVFQDASPVLEQFSKFAIFLVFLINLFRVNLRNWQTKHQFNVSTCLEKC